MISGLPIFSTAPLLNLTPSFLPARSVSDKDHDLDPRFRDTVLWCARGTSTYVIIELIRNLQPNDILSVLANALFDIQDHIAQHGDGLLQHGIFMFNLLAAENVDCHFYAANTNNHQLTWGVVGSAVQALSNYMLTESNAGVATFTIFDGGTEVGFGSIDVVPAKK